MLTADIDTSSIVEVFKEAFNKKKRKAIKRGVLFANFVTLLMFIQNSLTHVKKEKLSVPERLGITLVVLPSSEALELHLLMIMLPKIKIKGVGK